MKYFTILIYAIHFLLLSCSGQTQSQGIKKGTTTMDTRLPKQIEKSIVSTAGELKWKSTVPIHIHNLKDNRTELSDQDRIRQNYKIINSVERFSILNNGAIYAKTNTQHFFSRDHGHNWHVFDGYLEDGSKMRNYYGFIKIYSTGDYFVLRATRTSDDTNEISKDDDAYDYYVSNNGSVWKRASDVEFNIENYVFNKSLSLLYRKANPEVFENLKNTRPNDYHLVVYDMKEMLATIYPYYHETFILPKELQYASKSIFKLCDGNYVHPRHNFSRVEKGESLNSLVHVEYRLPDGLISDYSGRVVNNRKLTELGCHLTTELKTRDSQGRESSVQAVLSNNPDTPGQIELINGSSSRIYSSPNGKYMITKRDLLSINENMLSCPCD